VATAIIESDVSANRSEKSSSALVVVAPLLLYCGVLSGMFLFESGWAAILGYHAAICLVLTLSRGWPAAAALQRGWNPLFGAGMTAVCLVSGVAIFLLWPFIHLEGVVLSEGLRRLGLHGMWWWVFVAYYSLVNPWLEELFWRGWYPDQLRRPMIADALFAGYHVFVLLVFVQTFWALVAFFVLSSTAFVWRWFARRTKGLLVPVASHMAADISVIAAAALLVAAAL
jgi:membrane protease YdiL (CAAX protease family)